MFVGITNTPRDYAWGSTTAIAELLGTRPSGGPEAELWLGAHPGSPARIVSEHPDARGAADATLLDLVDGRLPFLLKVLAAGSPLSLQAHPTPAQAEAGFEREEAAGVPIDAPHRNYKDRFHKPEIIYALSDSFRALCGFRPVAETRAVLETVFRAEPVAGDDADARVAPLLDRLVDDGSLRDAFEWLISGGDDVDEVVAAVVEAASVADGPSWSTVRLLAEHYPGDPGIVISLLLNTVELAPGEVLYLPAGNIHAYLEGLGIELMASSDNVLRGGLTPKHVDVPELLSVLDFRPVPVPYLRPEEPQEGVAVFRPDVPDFVLTVVAPSAAAAPGGATVPLGASAIVLCTEGSVRLSDHVTVGRGEAVYLADEPSITVTGDGRLFVATTSLPG